MTNITARRFCLSDKNCIGFITILLDFISWPIIVKHHPGEFCDNTFATGERASCLQLRSGRSINIGKAKATKKLDLFNFLFLISHFILHPSPPSWYNIPKFQSLNGANENEETSHSP